MTTTITMESSESTKVAEGGVRRTSGATVIICASLSPSPALWHSGNTDLATLIITHTKNHQQIQVSTAWAASMSVSGSYDGGAYAVSAGLSAEARSSHSHCMAPIAVLSNLTEKC